MLYDLEMEKREREMREAEEEKARRRAEQKAKLEASRYGSPVCTVCRLQQCVVLYYAVRDSIGYQYQLYCFGE